MVGVVVVWWEIEGGDYGGLEVVVIGEGFWAGFPGGEEAVGIELRGALCVCSCMFEHLWRMRGAMLAGGMISSAKTQPYQIVNHCETALRSYLPFL